MFLTPGMVRDLGLKGPQRSRPKAPRTKMRRRPRQNQVGERPQMEMSFRQPNEVRTAFGIDDRDFRNRGTQADLPRVPRQIALGGIGMKAYGF